MSSFRLLSVLSVCVLARYEPLRLASFYASEINSFGLYRFHHVCSRLLFKHQKHNQTNVMSKGCIVASLFFFAYCLSRLALSRSSHSHIE